MPAVVKTECPAAYAFSANGLFQQVVTVSKADNCGMQLRYPELPYATPDRSPDTQRSCSPAMVVNFEPAQFVTALGRRVQIRRAVLELRFDRLLVDD
jgi:hypothetical protein